MLLSPEEIMEEEYWSDADEKISKLVGALQKILKHENERLRVRIGYDDAVHEFAKNALIEVGAPLIS